MECRWNAIHSYDLCKGQEFCDLIELADIMYNSRGRGLIAAYYNYCRLVWTFQHVSYRRHGDNIFVLFGLIIACVFRLIITS